MGLVSYHITGGYQRNGLAADKALDRIIERCDALHIKITDAEVRSEDNGEDNIVDFVIHVPSNITKTEIRKKLSLTGPQWVFWEKR